MKICVISSQVFSVPLGGYGGLEAIAHDCAKGLAAKGHQVSLIAPSGSTCPGVEIIETGPPGRVSERDAYSRYWQRLLDFDVIIDHSWGKYAYLLKGEGKLKTPVLGVLHAPVNTMLNSLPPNVEKPCFVCISEDQRQHFEALFSPAKAMTCYNGVDPEIYKPIEGVKRTDRFLFLARFSSVKGADTSLRACLEAGVGLDLIGDTKITGEPEYFEMCKRLAEQSSPCWDHSKGKQLRILGGVGRGETVWWYSQALAFLHSAKNFREPFGLTLIESQMCELPVVTFDNGACRETVPTEGGSLAPTEREFVEAIKIYAKANLEPLRKEARRAAMRFSVEAMVDRYEELCIEALNKGW